MVPHFRSNLLSWLSVSCPQPYFAWHPLIREQERPCLRALPGRAGPGLPSLHQGLACGSACVQNAPGLLLSLPLSLTHNPKVLNPFIGSKPAAMVHSVSLSHGISQEFSGNLGHLQRQDGSSAVGCALEEPKFHVGASLLGHGC